MRDFEGPGVGKHPATPGGIGVVCSIAQTCGEFDESEGYKERGGQIEVRRRTRSEEKKKR